MPSGCLKETGGRIGDGSGIDENGLWAADWAWLADGISGVRDPTPEV